MQVTRKQLLGVLREMETAKSTSANLFTSKHKPGVVTARMNLLAEIKVDINRNGECIGKKSYPTSAI